MRETSINWLHDREMATIDTNDLRIIGQLEALAEKVPADVRLLDRHRDGSEKWMAKKSYLNISDMGGNK